MNQIIQFLLGDFILIIVAYQVFANADSPEDAIAARKNGAEGIGLCRTEHMVQIIFNSSWHLKSSFFNQLTHDSTDNDFVYFSFLLLMRG